MNGTVIDIVEAGYDLQVEPRQWLPNLLEVGLPMLDRGLGVGACVFSGVSTNGEPLITDMHMGAGPPDLLLKQAQAQQEAGRGMVMETIRFGSIANVSDVKESHPEAYEIVTRYLGCKDALGVWGIDPDWHGVNICVPLPEVAKMSPRTRARWIMLATHIAAGHRLRRQVFVEDQVSGTPITDLPLDAEALVDPTRFEVKEARGDAQVALAIEQLRAEAVRVDRARGSLRRTDPDEALEIWQGLVRGRWSMVDWYDSDGRRYVLAKPNQPKVLDPRGLTEREAQVAAFLSVGDTNRFIGYRLGLTEPRVSQLVNSTMRKLGAKTPAELIGKWRGFPPDAT